MSSLFWTRSTCALLLTPLFACVLRENGSTFGGSNVGRPLTFEGYSDQPQESITVQVLDPADQDPDSNLSTWVTFAWTITESQPLTIGTESGYYWHITGTPVANNGQQTRWQPGGLARFRALKSDGTVLTTFDSLKCVEKAVDRGKNFTETAAECQSHDSPILTFVDRDPMSALAQPRKYLDKKRTSFTDATKYYDVIAPPATLEEWKTFAGFPDVGEVEARYYNKGDLGIGREMHCREGVSPDLDIRVACYVSNYGFTNDYTNDVNTALALAISGDHPFATVAMTYAANGSNKVRFYTYNDLGVLVKQATLDSEGIKDMPGLCIACHGGTYNNGVVTGAKFLPFDLNAFAYANSGDFTRANQEESFRKLNEMVLQSEPGPSTEGLIKGWYGDTALHTVGTKQNSSWVPPGYAGEEVVYLQAVAPYCRTCHVASSLPMDTFAQLQALNPLGAVCGSHDMPHAELTRKAFWQSSARAHLAGALNWSTHCK